MLTSSPTVNLNNDAPPNAVKRVLQHFGFALLFPLGMGLLASLLIGAGVILAIFQKPVATLTELFVAPSPDTLQFWRALAFIYFGVAAAVLYPMIIRIGIRRRWSWTYHLLQILARLDGVHFWVLYVYTGLASVKSDILNTEFRRWFD